MRTINLGSLPCLGNETQIKRLNSLIEISDNLMPHQVAVATGCGSEEALALLLLLFRLSVVESLLLVYHNAHLGDSPPVLARNLFDGFSQLPFICDICQEEVSNISELSYDFLCRSPKRFVSLDKKHDLYRRRSQGKPFRSVESLKSPRYGGRMDI